MANYYDPNPTYCSTCGTEIEPDARFCPNCGAVTDPQGSDSPAYAPGMPYAGGAGYGEPANVPNYLIWAILVTVFSVFLLCNCVGIIPLVPGILAIVFASQVNGKLQAGDYDGALNASKQAKMWCWIATGACIFVIIVGVLLFAILGFGTIFSWL